LCQALVAGRFTSGGTPARPNPPRCAGRLALPGPFDLYRLHTGHKASVARACHDLIRSQGTRLDIQPPSTYTACLQVTRHLWRARPNPPRCAGRLALHTWFFRSCPKRFAKSRRNPGAATHGYDQREMVQREGRQAGISVLAVPTNSRGEAIPRTERRGEEVEIRLTRKSGTGERPMLEDAVDATSCALSAHLGPASPKGEHRSGRRRGSAGPKAPSHELARVRTTGRTDSTKHALSAPGAGLP